MQGPEETCYTLYDLKCQRSSRVPKDVHQKKNSLKLSWQAKVYKKKILITSRFQCPSFLTLNSSRPHVPHCLLHWFWSPSYQQSPIHRFCHTTAIITFSREVVQGLWRCKPATGKGEINPFRTQFCRFPTLNLLHDSMEWIDTSNGRCSRNIWYKVFQIRECPSPVCWALHFVCPAGVFNLSLAQSSKEVVPVWDDTFDLMLS